jgi:hypothetical protein
MAERPQVRALPRDPSSSGTPTTLNPPRTPRTLLEVLPPFSPSLPASNPLRLPPSSAGALWSPNAEAVLLSMLNQVR